MQTHIVDDDRFILKLLDRQLRQLGHDDIHLWDCAEQALAGIAARLDGIDLVFCDLQMPRIDGVEFVRHLADLGYRGGLVLVSGENERTLQTARRLAEAHGIRMLGALAKPVSIGKLCDVLDEHRTGTARAVAAEREKPPAAELEAAIGGRRLVNFYQPKIDFATGGLVGVEALVRWEHRERGMLAPDQFIDTAERHGLIDALTQHVLGSALRQWKRWNDAGLDLMIAVNVSMDNLAALDFPDTVARLADEAGTPIDRLALEITETRLMTDLRAPLDIFGRLRLKHVTLSIDDFGTGHSSLSKLRDIPFDELKIDRTFVHGAHGDPALKAIVETTLALARQLDMRTVAEGIEDHADYDLLHRLGCNVAQGYYIARPMRGPDIVDWQRARQASLAVPG